MLGGKSRWIDIVWARIGKVGVWSEPCCGTAVMTLNNPEPAPREVIAAISMPFVANFYRAVRGDYEQAAYWADWPTNHHDLTARHRWLLRWGAENAAHGERGCRVVRREGGRDFGCGASQAGSGTGGATCDRARSQIKPQICSE